MNYYGKSEEVCNKIISQFKSGNLPDVLAPIFINRKDSIPSASWSFLNQMVMIMNGTNDARTFKQWNSVGRKVNKGSKAFQILGPCIKSIPKEDDSGETTYIKILYGFKGINVFPIENTEIYNEELWEKKSGEDKEEIKRLESLPLREVAEKWGLDITSYNAKAFGALGYYQHGKRIALGVENLSTWCHELVHASDDKLGTINKTPGQDPENEIVAEIGGAVLLKILGEEKEADLGGAWKYVTHYAGSDENKTIKKVSGLIDRICKCVDLILSESNLIINDIK